MDEPNLTTEAPNLTAEASEESVEVVTAEMLVEEVSIDGMCGVY